MNVSRLFCALLLLLPAACSKPDPPLWTLQTLDFHTVLAPEDPGFADGLKLPYHGDPLVLGEAHSYHIVEAAPGKDGHGAPIVRFRIHSADAAAFGDYTESLRDKRMAVVVDDVVLTAPVVQDRLPGNGVLAGGQGGFTQDQVEALVERLSTRR